jgi:hypothetical protein
MRNCFTLTPKQQQQLQQQQQQRTRLFLFFFLSRHKKRWLMAQEIGTAIFFRRKQILNKDFERQSLHSPFKQQNSSEI